MNRKLLLPSVILTVLLFNECARDLCNAPDTAVSAQPTQLITAPEQKTSWHGKVEYAKDHERGKGPCFVLYGKYPTPLIYKTFIPVEADKTYVLKASFRTLDPALPASGYMGLKLYDAQKRKLCFNNVSVQRDTDSEVVSAKKGDKFLIVKMNPKWQKSKYCAVAFNARKDFSDIPNFDVSPQCGKMSVTSDGYLKVELRGKLKKDYPAGTPVRLHAPWGTTMYYLASGWMPAGEGKDFISKISGIKDTPGTSSVNFWKGTKYVRPFIWFGNWNRIPKKGAKLLIDGFSFERL